MERTKRLKFIRFLREELALPGDEIRLAWRQSDQSLTILPMVLWQYGLVTLTQLNQIFDWLEQSA